MKAQFIKIIPLIFILTQLSCVVRIPITNNTEKLHSSALKVQPAYQVTKKGNKGFLVFGSSIGFGGIMTALAYNNKYKNYSNELRLKNSLETGGTIAGLTLAIMGYLAITGEFGSKFEKRTYIENVKQVSFDNWLTDFNNKSKQTYINYRKDKNYYLLIPTNSVSAFEAEENRLDLIAYEKVINGQIGAYNDYISSRPLNSQHYSSVLKIQNECTAYYNAMNFKLSESRNFENMLSDCNYYMNNYQNGNIVFRQNVYKRIYDINSIPIEIRQKQHNEIVNQIQEARKEATIRHAELWILVFGLILSSDSDKSNSNNYDSKTCSRCMGLGKVWQYESGSSSRGYYDTCLRCQGSGKAN